MSDLHPTSCNESMRLGNIYICRLACSPCSVPFGKTCEKLKLNAFMTAMKELMKEQADEVEEC